MTVRVFDESWMFGYSAVLFMTSTVHYAGWAEQPHLVTVGPFGLMAVVFGYAAYTQKVDGDE